jgi:predicted membrane channel-forming protein YqfA (hemolysin III family)
MKKKLIALSSLVLGFAPVVALAQVTVVGAGSGCNAQGVSDVFGILCRIGQILNAIVPVLIALGIVYFVWGVITYVVSSDEEAKKTGRDRMIWGIIGLAVIVAVWGLVALLRNTFNVSNSTTIELPTVPVVIPGN